MSPGVPVAWLPSFLLLLLLWFPGCVPLSGPEMVTGIVGGSLSVQCQYEEEYKTYDKYWCRKWLLRLRCSEIVRTSSSEEVRKGRVSIRDHPANLTFTVTLENLTLDDADTYWCGIKTPFLEGLDKSFRVKVSVVPGPTPGPAPGPAPGPSTDVTAKPLATRSTFPVPLPTALGTETPTQGSSSTEGYSEDQGLSLPALLSVLGLLLLLLVVTSMLAWRMFQKRVKVPPPSLAVEHPELSQNLRQGTENTEPQYVNLQLHTLPLREKPVPPSQVEVEYSTVEEVHYSSVVFDSKNQDSNANGVLTRTPQGQETEYSVVQKPRKAGSEPQL